MQTILLLHGAIGSANQLQPLAKFLAADYDVHTLDFSGHGGLALPEDPFSIEIFAKDVLDFMSITGLQKASIFGYSMGGYVAMYLARYYPDKVDKIMTLATKYNWDREIAVKETAMLDARKIEEKLPAFAKALKERHAPTDWKEVLNKTADMLNAMGGDNPLKITDYKLLTQNCLLLLGDRDKMVTIDETVAVYNAIPNCQFAVLPATAHPIEQIDIEMLCYFIKKNVEIAF